MIDRMLDDDRAYIHFKEDSVARGMEVDAKTKRRTTI